MSVTSDLVRHPAVADPLGLAMDRAADGRPIAGNAVRHLPDSPKALDAMLALIARAERRVHLENYIIRADRTGQRFAAALMDRAAAGVNVRVVYDALGSFGTRGRYWRQLRGAGVEVRAFHPLATTHPLDLLSRNHRKLLVVDGQTAVVGGICLGDEWAGDAARHRQPWRDTVIEIEGPAALALEQTFARIWARTGPALADVALVGEPEARGDVAIRVVDGVPGRSRIFRVAQLSYDTACERIWIWDAYLVAPPALMTALLDAARGGVDVRVMVPSTSDVRVVRDITRFGYRDLLRAGARIFEWRGPMLHAKCMLTDRRWVRVGSTNQNLSSLYTNYELDVLIDSGPVAEELAIQFRKDMGQSNEIVLRPGRYLRRGRLVEAAEVDEAIPAGRASPHQRSVYERQVATVVTLRRLAGGLRRRLTATAVGILGALGVLLVLFPRSMSLALAAICFLFGGAIALVALRAPGIREQLRAPGGVPGP